MGPSEVRSNRVTRARRDRALTGLQLRCQRGAAWVAANAEAEDRDVLDHHGRPLPREHQRTPANAAGRGEPHRPRTNGAPAELCRHSRACADSWSLFRRTRSWKRPGKAVNFLGALHCLRQCGQVHPTWRTLPPGAEPDPHWEMGTRRCRGAAAGRSFSTGGRAMPTSTSLLTRLTEAAAPGSFMEVVSRRASPGMRAELPPLIAALTGEPGPAPTPTVRAAEPQVKAELHDPEFCWLIVHGTEYRFERPQQRQVVKSLFEARKRAGGRDGAGVSGTDLASAANSDACRFHVSRLFYRHQAWNTIVRPISKGVYALFLTEVAGQPQKNHARQPKRNQRRARIGRHGRNKDAPHQPPGTGDAGSPSPKVAPNRGR